MPIREELNTKMKEAMREKKQVSLSTIRLILAAIKDKDISERVSGHAEGISNDNILSLLQSMIKQRNDSVKTYQAGNRQDLVDREIEEIGIITDFLPKQLGESEIAQAVKKIVDEVGADSIKDMGKVMGALKKNYAGQLDMGKAGGVVKTILAG